MGQRYAGVENVVGSAGEQSGKGVEKKRFARAWQSDDADTLAIRNGAADVSLCLEIGSADGRR